MRRTVSNLIVIGLQLLIVGLFFVTIFNNDVKFEPVLYFIFPVIASKNYRIISSLSRFVIFSQPFSVI